MSMAFPVWPLLYILHTPLAWAGPLSTESLTPSLASIIPSCAQSCVESFVASNYQTVCGPPPNFDCLCVNDTPSGFTIGEGGLECLATGCSDFEEAEAVAIYEVCTNVPDAKPNTHPVLTASITSVTSHTVSTFTPTSTDNLSSAFPSNSFIGSFLSSPASSTASGSTSAFTSASFSTPSSITSPPLSQTISTPHSNIFQSTIPTGSSSSFSTTIATVAAASALAPVLSKPQIAGIVVAGVGVSALAFGLCVVLFLYRKRRAKGRYSGSSFGGGKGLGSEGSTPETIATRDFAQQPRPREEPPSLPPPPDNPRLRLVTPATTSEDGWDQYQRSLNTEDIGLAVGAPIRKSTAEPSPITPKSNRTTNSHLLPDKPTYSLFPSPLRINARNSLSAQGLQPRGIAASKQTPSSDGPRPTQFPNSVDNTSQANLLQRPPTCHSRSDPFLDPRNRTPPHMYPKGRSSRSPSPRLKYPDHPAFRVPSQPEPTDVARRPLTAHQSPSARGLYPFSNRSQRPELPSRPDQQYLGTNNNPNTRKRHSRNQSDSRRPLTYFSDGSETSFEDSSSEDGPETEARVRPRSNLSPVAESPKLGSPFHQQQGRPKYTDVPVTISASPVRYPNSSQPLSQPQPLSGGRLEEHKARDISSRLQSQQRPPDDSAKNTAKWQLLVSPGLQPLENPDSPSSPSARGLEGRRPPSSH